MASRKKINKKDNLVLIMKDMIEATMKKKCATFFKEDVDEVLHGAPNYYQIIKHPMHLNIMLNKLKNHQYRTPRDVFDDFMLIVANCKTYNTDMNNLVRKQSIELEETVRKAWEKKAAELIPMGIDLNNATLDYTQVDDSTLSQKKMSKEEANLRASQGYAATTDSNGPILNQYPGAPATYNPQPLSQSTTLYPQRARQTPVTSAPPSQTNMSSSQPLPAKQKMPRSPQNNNYQQPQQPNSYSNYAQPSVNNPPPAMFKPSYRPSYNPNTSASSSYGNNFHSEPTGGAASSMKIDLGSLGLNFGPFSEKNESENNFMSSANNTQQNNAYNNHQVAPSGNDTSFMENTYGDLGSTNMEKKDSFHFNFDTLPFDFPVAGDENPTQPTNGNGTSTGTGNGSGGMNIEPVKIPEPAITQTQTNNFYNPPEPKIDLSTSITINKPPVYAPVKTMEEVKPKPEPVVKPVVTPPPAIVQNKPKEIVEKPKEIPKPKPAPNRNIWERPSAKDEDDDDDEIFKIKIPKKEVTPSTLQASQESIKDVALKKIEPAPGQMKMEIEMPSKSLKPAILNNKPKGAEGDLSSKLLEPPKMEKKPSKTVVFEEFPEKPPANKVQEKNDDYSVHRSTSEKSTFNAPGLKPKPEIEKPSMKFKTGSEKTSGAAVTKRASEPPVESAPLNDENAIDHDEVLNGLLEDIQSSQNNLYEERSQENSNQSAFVKPKGDDGEDSNRTPKGSSTKKINLITKSAEKEREKEKEKKPDEIKPKISVHKPKPRIEEEEEDDEEEYYDDEEDLYSEPISKKDRGEREEEGSRIRFDLQAMKKDFETLKRSKVPKYIKKFKKNIRRLGKYFRDLEIKDEPLIKLREEVEHLNLTEKSFNYSRILLYLFNVLVFCKYYYEINDQQLKKLRKFINVIRKSFFYIKEAVKLQSMKFEEEEVETFEKSCREFRKAAHASVKQQKNKSREIAEAPSSNKIRINPAEFASSMPSKITIIEPSGDNKIAIKHPSLHHHHAPKKEGGLKLKLQNPAKKVPKVEPLEPKEETEEDIIKKEMSKYLTEIRVEFEAKGFHDNLDHSVLNSWKHGEEKAEAKSMEEEPTKAKPEAVEEEKAATKEGDSMEVENDNIFPVTSTISFSLAMPMAKGKSIFQSQNKKRPAGSSSTRSIAFKMEDEKEQGNSSPLWKPNPSLFLNDERVDIYTVNFIPNQHTIAEGLVLDTGKYSINKSAPLDQEVAATFFGNKSDDQGTSSLVKRGVKCTTVSSSTSNEFINKLAIIRIKLKQSVSVSPQDEQRQNEINLSVKHSMPIESYDKMQNIADERIKNEIKLKDYSALLPLTNIKELMEENRFFDRILEKIRMDNWKFDRKLALFYNLTASQNDKFTQWDINLLTFIDNVNQFKLIVNNKTIL